jgi:hypothetical protein
MITYWQKVALKKFLIKIKSLVEEDVLRTPMVIVSAITLATNKTFIFEHLLNEDGERPMEVLKGKKLHQMMGNTLKRKCFYSRCLCMEVVMVMI